MKGFEPVTLPWGEQTYTVPANKVLGLVREIEDALEYEGGPAAVYVLFRPGGVRLTRLAGALGAALRYAGASVTDDEVYLTLMEDVANMSQSAMAQNAQVLVATLLTIIAPPVAQKAAALGAEDAKKKQPAVS